jgi:hypothetical protein
MPFCDYLPVVIFIGLALVALYPFVEVFIGHFNVWLSAVPILFVLCIPFIGDCVALVLVLQAWSNREAERIWNRL